MFGVISLELEGVGYDAHTYEVPEVKVGDILVKAYVVSNGVASEMTANALEGIVTTDGEIVKAAGPDWTGYTLKLIYIRNGC